MKRKRNKGYTNQKKRQDGVIATQGGSTCVQPVPPMLAVHCCCCLSLCCDVRHRHPGPRLDASPHLPTHCQPVGVPRRAVVPRALHRMRLGTALQTRCGRCCLLPPPCGAQPRSRQPGCSQHHCGARVSDAQAGARPMVAAPPTRRGTQARHSDGGRAVAVVQQLRH